MEQLGMIVLDTNKRVQSMTQGTGELLTQYFPISSFPKSYLPTHLQRWVNYQVSLLTQEDDITSPSLPLRVEQEDRKLIIRLICDRLNKHYLLILEEQPPQSFSPESLQLLGLTRREAEVLFWIAKDKSTKEIASMFICSEKTVKKHLEHIYEKFGVRTRVAAVVSALERLGIVN